MMPARLSALLALLLALAAPPLAAEPYLPQALEKVPAADLVPGAERYGPVQADPPVAPVLKGDKTVGWAFVTSDVVSTTGYSGKPIHTLVALDPDAHVAGVRLVKHSEPIVLIGIPQAKMDAMAAGYIGLDLVAEAKSGGTAHDVDIISGATVRDGDRRQHRARRPEGGTRPGAGGLAPDAAPTGPQFELNPTPPPPGLDDAGRRRHAPPPVAGRGPGERGLRRPG